MRFYSRNYTTGRNYGSDAIRRILAEVNARYVLMILESDDSSQFNVTLNNKDLLVVSNTDVTADGYLLNSKAAVMAWVSAALLDNREQRLHMQMIANASQRIGAEIDALVFTPEIAA